MIAILEWTQSNVQQNTEQLQTPTMGVTINKKSTTTEPPPQNGQQPKPPGGLNALYWYQIFALEAQEMFSSHGGHLTYAMYHHENTLLYYLLYNYQRTLEETGKRGQETYYLKSCLQLSSCLAFHRLLECTGIKVCLITSFLVKPSSSRTLLVQTPQLTFVSRNRIPDILLHSSSP